MRYLRNQPLRIKLALVFGIVLLLVLAQSFFAAWSTTASRQGSEAVAQTLNAIAVAEDTDADILGMQTGYRGFLLTGSESFLEPYRMGFFSYRDNLDRLRGLTASQPAQVDRWNELEQRIGTWIRERTESGIALRRRVDGGAGSLGDVASFAAMPGAREQFDAIHDLLETGIAYEQENLNQLSAAAARNSARLLQLLLAGTGAVVAIAVAAAILLARDLTGAMNRLVGAAQGIATGNARHRVRLQRSDEIGRVGAAFDRMAANSEARLAELRQERDLLQTLMENVPDQISFKDAGSRYVRVNHAEARALGQEHPEDIVGKTDRNFYPENIAESKVAAEQRLQATGSALVNYLDRQKVVMVRNAGC